MNDAVATLMILGGVGWLAWSYRRDRSAGFPRTRRRYRRSV